MRIRRKARAAVEIAVASRELVRDAGWRAPQLAWGARRAHGGIPSPHYPGELTRVMAAVLRTRGLPGAVAEFGCYLGGSTAKLSLAARVAGKRLLVFDSFEGLPEPAEWDAEHQIERPRRFRRGEYAGALETVQANVARFGDPSVCEYVPGWFSETLPGLLDRPLAVAFVDVDLGESTAAALEAVEPRLVAGGACFVHDATDPKLRDIVGRWAEDAGLVVEHLPARPEPPYWTLAHVSRRR